MRLHSLPPCLALVFLLLPGSPSASGMCSGGGGPPPPPGTPGGSAPNPAERYLVGDYARWWGINRDDILLSLKEEKEGDFAEYERKKPPPDALQDLLALVGYEGDFCSIVKEIGLRRLKKFPKLDAALLEVLKDPNPRQPTALKAWAAYALGDLKRKRAIPDLIAALKHKNDNVRGFAAVALGKMNDPAAFEAILPLAVDVREPEDLRCMVFLSLIDAQAPKIREALAQAARSENSVPVRRSALIAMGFKASRDEQAILVGVCEDRDPYVRAAAVLALGLSGGDLGPVLTHLDPKKDRDSVVRAYAALALGARGGPGVASALLLSLQDEKDFGVRGCAALALGRSSGPGVVETLSEAVGNRKLSFVANYAAIGLGLTGKREALPALAKGLGAKQFDLITSCATGIAILGYVEGTEPLLKSLENRHHAIVREYAAVALGRLRDPSVKERLFLCMSDKTVEVRHAAAIALAVYGNPEACPLLEKGLEDKQEIVRRTSALAFDLLNPDEDRALVSGERFKADPRSVTSRQVGQREITRLLNLRMPANYKLPITP